MPEPVLSLPVSGRPAAEVTAAIESELAACGAPERNLASYLTTTMRPEAAAILHAAERWATIDGIFTVDYERRCVEILAGLWHGDPRTAVGVALAGSSEAAFLALAAMAKRRTTVGRPNLVLAAHNHICWEKACDYLGVEARFVGAGTSRLDPESAAAACDGDTIGLVAVMGSPFTGRYDPVGDVCAALDELAARDGIDVPVHVDAASGGLVAPFLAPETLWDFGIDRVVSINTSSHKWGQVYAALGWTLWRDRDALPASMTYQVECVGGRAQANALSFTRNAGPLAAQYFLFEHLGFAGYAALLRGCQSRALDLAAVVEKHTPYAVLSRGDDVPVVTFTMAPKQIRFDLDNLADRLAATGWYLPTYPLTPGSTERMARIVVRPDLSDDLFTELVDDLHRATEALAAEGGSTTRATCRI